MIINNNNLTIIHIIYDDNRRIHRYIIHVHLIYNK